MDIQVQKMNETEDEYVFGVELVSENETHTFTVEAAKEYVSTLTAGRAEPEALIRASFEFLLEREPAASILREFDLKVIPEYFPEYEKDIQTFF